MGTSRLNLRGLTDQIEGTRVSAADALCNADTWETLTMLGFGIDDIVYTALGVVALTLLAGLAARSKRICDRVSEIARRCEQWHRDNGHGGPRE